MRCMIVRGATGSTIWIRGGKPRAVAWICERDGFRVAAPLTPSAAEVCVVAIVAHAVQLAGAVQQIVELDL